MRATILIAGHKRECECERNIQASIICLRASQHLRESADFPGRPDMSVVCSACGATVDRRDCHKNRYGEYICRKCASAGIKFTRRRRLRLRTQAKLRKYLPMLPVAALILLLIWVLYEGLLG
jgi:hypothetical protein